MTPVETKRLTYLIVSLLCALLIILVVKSQYLLALIAIGLMMLLINNDRLKHFKFSATGMEADFHEKKLAANIKENKEPVTKNAIEEYSDIEALVVAEIKKRYRNDEILAEAVLRGSPDQRQRADIVVRAPHKEIIFEVKYVKNPSAASAMVRSATRMLMNMAPDSTIEKHIVLVGTTPIDVSKHKTPKDIKLEFLDLNTLKSVSS